MKGPSHAVSLGVFVDEALSFIDSHAIPLDAVAVSCGPGSYTGLRIGVSMAKGVCYGRNVPLIGIPTLEVLTVPVLLYHDLPEDALLCPMIDARRMEVYAAVYDRRLQVKRAVAADIVDENSYLEFLNEQPVYFFGNGADKCREQITHPNAHFIDNANTIINIMGNMFPHLRDVPDFKHKLWDHLAIMSGFELDIDYPYEIIRKDNLVTRPDPIPYSTARMRYRHYGRTLEVLIKKAIEFPEGNEKRNLIALICNHMKKDYLAWNKDTVDDKKIAEDLYELSNGELQMTDDIVRLMAERLNQNYRPKTNYTNNRQNNKRRY